MAQPTSFSIARRFFCVLTILLVAIFSRSAPAQSTDPAPLAGAAGKVGAFQATLTERSPLSQPKEILKRVRMKPEDAGEDYDVSKSVFQLYVPKEPGGDQKYGVIVGQCFKEYGIPPEAWCEVLEKHHLIWISAESNGDGTPAIKRIGLLLDSIHNVRKYYAIDDRRVYVSMNGCDGPAGGIPLYYSDVIGGAIYAVNWPWFQTLKSQGGNAIWPSDQFPMPTGDSLGTARLRGRYFFVSRTESSHEMGEVIFKQGYVQSGFKYAKMINVPTEVLGHYASYQAAFFEEGVQFLDAPLAALSKVAVKEGTKETPNSPAEPVKSPTPLKPANSGENADKARLALDMAKNYVTLQKYDAAKPKLQKIIETYPGTPAAKEAKALLREIDAK